jgi:hypothetical protein
MLVLVIALLAVTATAAFAATLGRAQIASVSSSAQEGIQQVLVKSSVAASPDRSAKMGKSGHWCSGEDSAFTPAY